MVYGGFSGFSQFGCVPVSSVWFVYAAFVWAVMVRPVEKGLLSQDCIWQSSCDGPVRVGYCCGMERQSRHGTARREVGMRSECFASYSRARRDASSSVLFWYGRRVKASQRKARPAKSGHVGFRQLWSVVSSYEVFGPDAVCQPVLVDCGQLSRAMQCQGGA